MVARLHKAFYQGSWFAVCRSSKLDRGCAVGLQIASFDVIERLEEPTGRCSLPELPMVTSLIRCKQPGVPTVPCSPAGYLLADRYRRNYPSID